MKKNILIILLIFGVKIAFAFEIYTTTSTTTLNDNCKLYITYFWSDNDTPKDVKDDILLGYDAILDCKEGNNIANEENNNILLNSYLSEYLPEEKFKKILGLDKPIIYSQFKNRKKALYNKLKDLPREEIHNRVSVGRSVKFIYIKK